MAAAQFIVEGGRRLSGTIRAAGNKNAALPIVAGTLVTDQPVTLENVPRIRDIEVLVDVLRSMGAQAEWTEHNLLSVHAREIDPDKLDHKLSAKIRGSILLAGPLLGRCGHVTLPPPGGIILE